MFSNLSLVYAVFEVNTVTSLHFIDGQRVNMVIAGRNWKQCCFGEGLAGGGTKIVLRSNAKVANFCVRCDVSC